MITEISQTDLITKEMASGYRSNSKTSDRTKEVAMSDLTVENILKGSKRINEMKEEVKNFISIALGLIGEQKHAPGISSNGFLVETSPNGCTWSFYGVLPNLIVEVIIMGRSRKLNINFPPSALSMEDTLLIHASLPTVLEGLLKNPGFEERVAPLIEASKL